MRKKRERRLKIRLVFYIMAGLFLVFLAVFGDKITPYDPYETNMFAIDRAPGREFLLGTDNLGRDILSRIIVGTRSSMVATLIIMTITLIIGTTLGVMAGYYGGVLDIVVMKIVLIFQSFPGQVMAIAVAGVLGAGIKNAAVALGVVGWTGYARISRSLVLKIKNTNYIKAARLCGCHSLSIIFHHVLPNIRSVIFVNAMTSLSGTILEISSLSFLGLSAKPPTPEWGFMMNEGRKVLMTAPWQAMVPGFAILVTVIILNRLGDSVQDYMELKSGR